MTERVKALDGDNAKLHRGSQCLGPNGETGTLPLDDAHTCSFCLVGAVKSIVEVRYDNLIAFSFDPIVVSGSLKVRESDETRLIYVMTGAGGCWYGGGFSCSLPTKVYVTVALVEWQYLKAASKYGDDRKDGNISSHDRNSRPGLFNAICIWSRSGAMDHRRAHALGPLRSGGGGDCR